MFGAKYFTEFDFIDFYSGSFITECLRIAELVPNGTTKASSPLTVASYPCYGEAHVIRPHDPNDIARLQKSSSSTSVVASSSNYTSPSDPSWNMNLPTIRPQKGGVRDRYTITVFSSASFAFSLSYWCTHAHTLINMHVR
tara:strand:+ start:803 stop:1222 length:420 start_codon:yes stop_codon:yes gene_type:complete